MAQSYHQRTQMSRVARGSLGSAAHRANAVAVVNAAARHRPRLERAAPGLAPAFPFFRSSPLQRFGTAFEWRPDYNLNRRRAGGEESNPAPLAPDQVFKSSLHISHAEVTADSVSYCPPRSATIQSGVKPPQSKGCASFGAFGADSLPLRAAVTL
jgi:hypothetical protein